MSGQPQGEKFKEQFGNVPFLAKPFTTDQLLTPMAEQGQRRGRG
jgi:hypothetical protein